MDGGLVRTQKVVAVRTHLQQLTLKTMFGTNEQELATNLREAKIEGVHECLQGPGEVLFIPQFWHHAVLNMGEVLAMTFEGAPHYKTTE